MSQNAPAPPGAARALAREQPQGIFYGWYVVAVAFVANFVSTGTGFYVFNAFMIPLCEAHGWTRAQLNLAPMLGFAAILLGQFVFGTILAKVGPRLLMTLGPLLSSAAFIMLGRVDSLAGFFAFYMLLMVGWGAMGGIVANTVVSNWFERRRGKALGLATTGISFSGAVVPLVAAALVESSGLVAAFTYIGTGILIVSPLAWLIIRNTPESLGLRPDGGPAAADTEPELAETAASDHGEDVRLYWTVPRLMRCGSFWRLGLAYGLVFMGIAGTMYQLAPRFADMGFSPHHAMLLMSLAALMGTLGKYVWGHFCDHRDPRKVVALMMMLVGTGLGLGVAASSLAMVILFAMVFGFAMGGVVSTFAIMTAHLFGRRHFAQVFRLMAAFLALEVLGFLAMGQSYGRTGNYDSAFYIFICLDLTAAALVLTLPRHQVSRPDTTP